MKRILLLPLLALACQTETTQQTPCSRNLEKYLNSSVKSFLKENPSYQRITIMDSKPGLAHSLLVVYSRDCTVELIPTKFEHMMPFDTNMGWNMEEFQKEKIGSIDVYSSDKLIQRIE